MYDRCVWVIYSMSCFSMLTGHKSHIYTVVPVNVLVAFTMQLWVELKFAGNQSWSNTRWPGWYSTFCPSVQHLSVQWTCEFLGQKDIFAIEPPSFSQSVTQAGEATDAGFHSDNKSAGASLHSARPYELLYIALTLRLSCIIYLFWKEVFLDSSLFLI